MIDQSYFEVLLIMFYHFYKSYPNMDEVYLKTVTLIFLF